MPLGASRGSAYHPEDVAMTGPWTLLETWSPAVIAEKLGSLVYHGGRALGIEGDRVAVTAIAARPNHCSLELIKVKNLTLRQTTSWRGTRQLRGLFGVGAESEDLSVTDPCFEQAVFKTMAPETTSCLLTISLGEPFRPEGADRDYCFKLIAAVMPLGDQAESSRR
jgi:hypothetical protein